MAKISHLLRNIQFLTLFLGGSTLMGCTSVEYEDKVSTANPLDAFESDMVELLNEFRAAAGVPAVTSCASLNVATSAHSDDMRDKGYLSDVAPDKSTTPTRACDAGYAPACIGTAGMVEFIAKGHGDAETTFTQWKKDATSSEMLARAEFVVFCVGRSLGNDSPIGTMNMADKPDRSCE